MTAYKAFHSNMTTDTFYTYASVLIFLPWALLIFAPNGRYTEKIAFACAIVLLVAAAWFTFAYLSSPEEGGGSLLSLNGLKNLFRSQEMLLTGWLNYLSFCLLVGTWICHDSRELKIGHIFVAPTLVLTLLTGPAGLLAYLLLRFFKTRKWSLG